MNGMWAVSECQSLYLCSHNCSNCPDCRRTPRPPTATTTWWTAVTTARRCWRNCKTGKLQTTTATTTSTTTTATCPTAPSRLTWSAVQREERWSRQTKISRLRARSQRRDGGPRTECSPNKGKSGRALMLTSLNSKTY